MIMDAPRVLIISNTALCKANSNGYSILSIMKCIPVDHRASFYIQDALPNKGTACSHFRLTDSEKLKSVVTGKHKGTVITDESIGGYADSAASSGNASNKESFFRHLMRDYIWTFGRWNRKPLYDWVKEFNPTVILFMNGRSPFMFNIVNDLSQRFDIPVVYFTSEDEYWHPPVDFWDRILRRRLRKATIRLNARVRHVIAFNDKLAELYRKEFGIPVTTIMPSSEEKPVDDISKGKGLLYAGNLKPYRYESLADIAKALKEVSPQEHIDVYSNDIDDDIRAFLSPYDNILMHDPVSREEVSELRRRAFVLFHFESFSEKAKPLIQHAFSSKVADCLALGIPFLVYAPEYCAFSSYMKDNPHSSCYVWRPDQLSQAIVKILFDADYRRALAENSHQLAMRDFDTMNNSSRAYILLAGESLSNKMEDGHKNEFETN